MEDGGGGADGRDPATGSSVGVEDGADAEIGAQVFDAGAAGKNEAVELLGTDRG